MEEVLRRVIGKTFSKLLKADVFEEVASDKPAVDKKVALKLLSTRLQKIYGLPSTECLLQTDTSNALNSMSRERSLHNAQFICPKVYYDLMITYQEAARLFTRKGMELDLQEGTTQRDNIAMAYYAIGMKALMERLEAETIV